MFSLHYLFLPDTCRDISYGYSGYELYMYACMRVYIHGATRKQGNDIFDSVIRYNSFESVFWMDTVEGVYVCACVYNVNG